MAHKTVKAIFCPWRLGKSNYNLLSCSFFARKRWRKQRARVRINNGLASNKGHKQPARALGRVALRVTLLEHHFRIPSRDLPRVLKHATRVESPPLSIRYVKHAKIRLSSPPPNVFPQSPLWCMCMHTLQWSRRRHPAHSEQHDPWDRATYVQRF